MACRAKRVSRNTFRIESTVPTPAAFAPGTPQASAEIVTTRPPTTSDRTRANAARSAVSVGRCVWAVIVLLVLLQVPVVLANDTDEGVDRRADSHDVPQHLEPGF